MNSWLQKLAGFFCSVSLTASCYSSSTDDMVESDKGADREESVPSASGEIPAIRMVLIWESINQGKNLAREDYFTRMEACNKAGWPTRQLNQDQIDKIGTARVELFFDERAPFVRQIEWILADESELDNTTDPRQQHCYSVLGERVSGGQDNNFRLDDSRSLVAADESAQIVKWKEFGWEFLGESTVAGQPCKRWRNQYQEICMWSGGKQWGFSDGPIEMNGCSVISPISYLNGFPLESKLVGEKRHGCISRIEVLSITKGLLPETENPSGFGDEG